jgi:hypothetical protein
MAQSSSSAHPIPEQAPHATRILPLLAGLGLAGLAVAAGLGLWFHYGTQVFFEMFRTGFAACF